MSTVLPDPIRFRCPTCQATVEAPLSRAGKRARCPCGQKVLVPAPPAVLNKTVLGEWAPSLPPALPTAPPPLPILTTLNVEPASPPPLPSAAVATRGRPRKNLASIFFCLIGVLLVMGGAAGTVFFFRMDTTVVRPDEPYYGGRTGLSASQYMSRMTVAANSGSDDERVYDMGLIDKRRNGLMVSLASVGFGIATVALGMRANKR